MLQHALVLDSNSLSVLRFQHMKVTGVSAYQLLIAAGAVALFSLFVMLPVKASALEVNTQTQQILPFGPNTCAPIQIGNFTPYIYNNNLSSFEFVVSDPAYVAVIGSVGNTSIPLRYMTRSMDVSGGIRYHIDINDTPIIGTVPVTVTLLSARTGAPVCASVISVNLGSGQVVSTPIYSGTPTTVTHPVKTIPVVTTPAATTSGEGSTATGTNAGAPVVSSGMENPLKGLCASEASAYRLWLILLVIYALIVGGLLWLEFPMSWSWAKTPERVASIMLLLLVLLLAFWYLSSACRAALWMPLLAFLIAILGLLAAFWNHPRVTQLLLIEETVASKKLLITPPPPAKPVIITPAPVVKSTTTTTTTTTSTVKK